MKVELKKLSEEIWETFDDIFRAVNKQNCRVEELEARVIELEKRLNEKTRIKANSLTIVNEMPTEKAA